VIKANEVVTRAMKQPQKSCWFLSGFELMG